MGIISLKVRTINVSFSIMDILLKKSYACSAFVIWVVSLQVNKFITIRPRT